MLKGAGVQILAPFFVFSSPGTARQLQHLKGGEAERRRETLPSPEYRPDLDYRASLVVK